MSESKFLPFQDVNGDGQNDDCPEKFAPVEPKECPKCTPNSGALVPNWREKTKFESFLNEKNCKYQITIVARNHKSTGASEGATEDEAKAALDDIYKEYEDEAIETLLETHDKDNSTASIEIIRGVIEYTDYWLPARYRSRLKLLYSIPHTELEGLPERDTDEEEEEDTSDITVTYSSHEMDPMMMKVRKGLNLYNRYLKVFRALEKGNLKFTDGDKIFNLENYGDIGFGGANAIMSKILPELDGVLNKYGYNIPNVGGYFSEVFNANDVVTEMTFTFDYKYKIKKIEFFTEGCGIDKQLFNSKAKELLSKSAWKDRTAMAYFTKLREMETALTARTPQPWIEFLTDFTYPEIYATQNEESLEQDALGCVGEALSDEAKELGQDILDDVFSIGDAIAFKFHQQLCKASLGEKLDEDIKLGVVNQNTVKGTYTSSLFSAGSEHKANIGAFATEQAFKELKVSESPFVSLCAGVAVSMLPPGPVASGVVDSAMSFSPEKQLDALWKNGFDELKICGLFDILMEAITCLFSGLTLEEVLGKVLEAGLRAMSINNLGDLFVGLPYEKQQEIGDMAKKKIQEGDVFPAGSLAQNLSDGIAGDVQLPSLTDWAGAMAQKESDKNSPNAASSVGAPTVEGRRTLATEYDGGGGGTLTVDADAGLGPGWDSAILEAYLKAILEVYGNDLLSLADELNRFPGAQMIATIIALMDCPRPPLFQPGLMDWMNDIELPICKNVNDIAWPKLINISAWYPKIKDMLRLLYEALKYAIQMVIIKIMIRLIVKLCELIGSAICNALGTVGDIAASLPDLLTGRDNLSNVIRDSICGPDADQEQVDDTVAQMVAELGVGGAALADRESALQFAQGISMSLTNAELTQALLGEATSDTLTIIDSYIEYEHPDYRDAMPNKEAIGSFMGNMGVLMPASFRASLRDQLESMPDDMPAHPSICADPEKLEEFKELRCEILEGRATPEQCSAMFDSMKDQMLDDLGDLSSVLQAISSPEALEEYLGEQMPPTYSDPGCDNGLLPYEPAATTATVTSGLGNILQQLKVDYGTDMLGNGPGQGNWGLVNMMLSDTMGNPLTAHMRKAAFKPSYTDYNGGWDPSLAEYAPLAFFAPPIALAMLPWTVMFQAGAFPTKVGAWLQDEMSAIAGSISVSPNNEWQKADSWTNSLEDMDMGGLFGADLDMVNLPNLGYDITMKASVDSDGVMAGIKFTAEGRKADPDLKISFSDNAAGMASGPNGGKSSYGYGYDIQAYFSDLYETEDGEVVNRKSDNMRIKIVNRYNLNARTNVAAEADVVADPAATGNSGTGNDLPDEDSEVGSSGALDESVQYEDAYEFLAVDDTLTGISDTIAQTLENYPNFLSSFQSKTDYTPQTLLLTEMLEDNGHEINPSTVKSLRADVMKDFLATILGTIADSDADTDETAWSYGAQIDGLTEEDIEYGVNEGGFTVYNDTDYSNKDMVLGMSRNQYDMEQAGTPELTRVFYLDPAKFGGNYVNPPLYIKPLKPFGWMGVIDAFFPELSPCKPQSTDLIDFGQIQDEMDKIYPSLSEDERLKSDPDCILEVPYNRILDRSAKAGLYGLIIAAIRIHVSAHMIKSLPTFTKFSPKFPDLFGSAYASYIVENMEEGFLDAQPAFWEVFNTFKDTEFWYTFLEMCVQMYNLQIDAGLTNPSPDVLESLFRLNDLQQDFLYPDKEDLKIAKKTDDASTFQTLKSYRMDKNLEAIRATEEDAKLVMKELVKQQLDYMSAKLEKNFSRLNLAPDIVDMGYYVLETMVAGSELTLNSAINPNGTFKAVYGDLPEVPYEDNEDADEPYYTYGAELVVEEDNDDSGFEAGQEYIGYYHVHIDEDYAKVYMAGEYHTEDAHDLLKPIANIITVPIGNVSDYGTVSATSDTSKPLILEKYISIDGTHYTPDSAVAVIAGNDSDVLLSEIYPGSMRIVENDKGEAVGIEGELGVRYGLRLRLDIEGTAHTIMTAEIDALDLKVKDFRTLTGDSKNLLCLINIIKESDEFQLLTRYIFGSAHLLSIAAIYNDMGMLPSIGEVTVANGETKFMGNPFYDSKNKPGMWKETKFVDDDPSLGVESVSLASYETDNPGSGDNTDGAWASKKNRSPGLLGGIGVMEWDNWDRELLTNSNSRIKKIFKAYYYSRNFDPDQIGKSTDGGPAAVAFKKLRGALTPAPGRQLIPWWQRKRLKSNPFNANDELCEKKDV